MNLKLARMFERMSRVGVSVLLLGAQRINHDHAADPVCTAPEPSPKVDSIQATSNGGAPKEGQATGQIVLLFFVCMLFR